MDSLPTIDLRDRVVVVTGAGQGQGAAEAARFRRAGAIVIATDVAFPHPAPDDPAFEYVEHDVTSPDSWTSLVAQIERTHGRLDGLVNNAGISRGRDVRGTSLEDWNAVLAVDLTGPFLGMQACAPLLARDGGGAVVNTGTAAAFYGFYRAAYAAAKWGLRGLTKSAALEFAPMQITVNAIHPGLVDSPMATESPLYEGIRSLVPLGRPTSADEIADLAVFLVSPAARTITGADFVIDGGLTAAGPMNQLATQAGLWS